VDSLTKWWAGLALQLKLQILIQGFLIIILVFAQQWILTKFEQQELSAVEERADTVADGLINGLNTLMITKVGDDEVIRNKASRALFIEKMGEAEGIKEMRIIRSEAVNDEFGVGLPQERAVDDMDHAVLASGKIQTRIIRNGYDAWLRTEVPFIASKNFRTTNCLKCHGVDEGAVLGAASVTIDIKDFLNNIKQANTWFWFGQGILQLILYFVISQIVRRLLSQLGGEPAYVIDIVRNIAKGNLTEEIVTRPGDSNSLLAAMKQMQSGLMEHEQHLEQIAHYDALTCLPNRVLLADRLQQGMIQAQRRGQRLAVVYLDLDGFKNINDLHGHAAGDQLLITVAARMKQALREGDTLARLGGDEFVAILDDLADVGDSFPIVNRVLSAASQSMEIEGLMLQVSASLGLTFYPQVDEIDPDQLLRQADQAMYHAKLSGKNRFHVFDAEHDNIIRGHHESLEQIRQALIARQFVLYYQPKVNMRSGEILGAEALIRWQHPEKGLLSPAAFLPVIENHHLAIEVGEWVIDAALSQIERWHELGLDISVSVNVGALQLQQLDFVAHLREILANHPNVKPDSLEIELLETSALEDLARVSQIIKTCREIGVKFSLDDFGTGYSSLAYLKLLPVTMLKIDQSFVRDMLGDPDDLAILNGVIGLSAAFRREVIAEGVETIEHGELLLQLGCELAQGYGIARPMPADELPGWSIKWKPDPSWVNQSAVSRDDWPLLFASVEHRAWIANIENHLRGLSEKPPPMDHLQCRFGLWLYDDKSQERYSAHLDFNELEQLHHKVHALADILMNLHAKSLSAEALTRLSELHGLRDTLVERMKLLMHDIQTKRLGFNE
jgi:diguanylate cyclase (GGDEF)-like protein